MRTVSISVLACFTFMLKHCHPFSSRVGLLLAPSTFGVLCWVLRDGYSGYAFSACSAVDGVVVVPQARDGIERMTLTSVRAFAKCASGTLEAFREFEAELHGPPRVMPQCCLSFGESLGHWLRLKYVVFPNSRPLMWVFVSHDCQA